MQDEVLIAGFGRRGHAVGDIPGVRFKVRGPLCCYLIHPNKDFVHIHFNHHVAQEKVRASVERHAVVQMY